MPTVETLFMFCINISVPHDYTVFELGSFIENSHVATFSISSDFV